LRPTLALHIVAGTLGLLFGYIALFSAKGGKLHRKSGMLFVYVMLAMTFTGALIAAFRQVAPTINIPAAILTAYLVITALTTVRPMRLKSRRVDIVLLLVALVVGTICLIFGFEAIANGGKKDGMPAFPYFMFALIGLLASVGDIQVLRTGARQGAPRLARHLWRMCWALWIAAGSFFFGQAKIFPPEIRILPLLAVPVFTVLIAMLYWLWRVRTKSVRVAGNQQVGTLATQV
jgi:uncharacterized membrane protein